MNAMNTGLEFAPTTDKIKKLVVGLFDPTDLLVKYRIARNEHQTSDLVLVVPRLDPPNFYAGPRSEYIKNLHQVFGKHASMFKITAESAHAMAQLPREMDAMWLVIHVSPEEVPTMCVLFSPGVYEQSEQAN